MGRNVYDNVKARRIQARRKQCRISKAPKGVLNRRIKKKENKAQAMCGIVIKDGTFEVIKDPITRQNPK